MMDEHASLEKYTSHTLFEMVAKGLRKGYVWEVSWRLNRDCIILTPSSFVFGSTSSSFGSAAQSGVLRAIALCWVLVLSTASYISNWLQLTEPVCGPGLYYCLTSTCFLWASHLHPIQPVHSQGYTLISSTGCACSLIDGWIGVQYVTHRYISITDTEYSLFMNIVDYIYIYIFPLPDEILNIDNFLSYCSWLFFLNNLTYYVTPRCQWWLLVVWQQMRNLSDNFTLCDSPLILCFLSNIKSSQTDLFHGTTTPI